MFVWFLIAVPDARLWRSPSWGGPASSKLTQDVYNETLGFDTVFVISMPSRTDRRDAITLSAALSGFRVEFIDGLVGKDVSDKAIPSGQGQQRLPDASVGSWRGHMNAIAEIVRRNLTTALILEDDVDWDIRLKDQLHNFALSSQILVQPLAHTKFRAYADPTFPKPGANAPPKVPDILLANGPTVEMPRVSPYGDGWDLLWPGHCGMTFPREDNKLIPKGRIVVHNDPTVAAKRYLTTWTKPDMLKAQYPEHARVVHHAQESLCSLGYAVTQKGARSILYEIGLKKFDAAFDLLLAHFCEGDGRGYHTCLSTQPSLFNNHLPAGPKKAESDISDHGDGWTDKASTPNVQWSVRLNFEALLAGKPPVSQFLENAEE
ncbi:glycosyl transferase family 25 [Microdochium nivale]|nr:glycosyl transferase family 25 [Microdochium nivale]